jgi:DNA (cytosine-5)-methyltransferase 1
MKLLDLFCGAGGAAMGYHRAGFEVVGVDIDPQPHFPFEFHQRDALDVLMRYANGDHPLGHIDAIHTSPPCQGYSTMSNRHGSDVPQLIDDVRWYLEQIGVPWVIENVTGARQAMISPLMLHGGQFGLRLYRPRLFESNVLLMAPPRAKRTPDAAAVYGRVESKPRLLWTREDGTELRSATLEEAREAMGMPWADWQGVREAIPPAYTEWIGGQLAAHVKAAA